MKPRSRTYNYLLSLMSRYQTKDLVNVDPESFRKKIDEFLELSDHEMEGFKDPDKQRGFSVKFHWGHNHDFGDFCLEGRMKDRHVGLFSYFIDKWKAIPKSLEGMRVLDIGCWTGGTSLLLCAMGAHVVAIEEVKKYIDALNYLKYAFNIDRLDPRNLSLYECITPEFQDAFDIVHFSGVIYHVTDPILALRIVFNCLKNGGVCLLESAVVDSDEPILVFKGQNGFWPSPTAIKQMMNSVGFADIKVSKAYKGPVDARGFAVGEKKTHVDMFRGGLSVRNIR